MDKTTTYSYKTKKEKIKTMSNVTYVHILHFAGANELKVICTLAVSSQAVEMLSKMESVHHD